MLGTCPTYRLFFTERGGERIVGTAPFEALNFSRVLDNISAATLVVTPNTREYQDVVKQLNPWQHEVAIVRGNKVVWQGPISDELNYTYSDNAHKVVISCQDILTWFNYRRVGLTKDYVNEDVGVIYNDLVNDAMSKDDSPNVKVSVAQTNVFVDRSYDASLRQIAWNALSELHSTGIDVTVVGRDVLVGPQEVPVADLGVLPKGTYYGVNVRRRGSDMMNDVTVTGSGSFGGAVTNGHYSSAVYEPSDITEFGLLEGQTANYTLTTVEDATQAAKTRWEFSRRPATYVQMTLTQQAPISVDKLIPGSLVTLADDTTLFTLKGQFRMSRVDFQVVGGEEGSQAEVVSPIWTNAGTFSEAI